MSLQRFFLVAAFALTISCTGADDAAEKTTEAVVKAVVDAETKAQPNTKKEDKNAEAGAAVAKATTEVLKTETPVEEVVDQSIIKEAEHNAKDTFKELADDGVASKAAADAAAKVAVETVDGAANLALPDSVKVDAEKAAIAAGKSVADHPNDQAGAVQEAVSTVKKEEETPGKALQKDKSKGLIAKAKDAVSELPQVAKDTVTDVAERVNLTWPCMVFIPCLIFLAIIVKKFDLVGVDVAYLKRLKQIRSDFDGNGVSSADLEKAEIETQYTDYSELQHMR
jgi:hypothetical protein